MKEKKKVLSPYKRKVHIDGEEWTYQMLKSGQGGYLKVCNPQRTKKYSFTIEKIGKSYSLEDYEWCPEEFDGEIEDLWSVAITPKNVVDIIEKNIISKEGK